MTSFETADLELYYDSLRPQDIVASLTLSNVENFLRSLGVEQIVVNEEKQYLICPTICHNQINEEASMKLYWYHDNKFFRCYTECNEAMSIFELYQKYMALNYTPISFEAAKEYVEQFVRGNIIKIDTLSEIENEKNKYEFKGEIPVLKEYPKQVLSYFTHYYHPNWIKDGILPTVMDKFQIKFSLSQNKVIIPHFDIAGRLIGIRGRAFEKKELEERQAKYSPVQIGNIIYKHPLGLNLYGIYEHQIAIKKRHSAIIVEGEKSVLLDDGYYNEYSNTVACCGSHVNKYQISLLTDILGVTEITIAFDKEYSNWFEPKAREYRIKIEKLCKEFNTYAQFYYIWDRDNLLNEKDSPFDRGKDIFEYLYKTRVKVN